MDRTSLSGPASKSPPAEAEPSPGLFPFVLCRIAGLSSDALIPLRYSNTVQNLSRLSRLDDEIALFRDQLCSQLFQLIGESGESGTRFALIRLKRSVHNFRMCDDSEMEELGDSIPEVTRSSVLTWNALLVERQTSKQDVEENYKLEESAARGRLREMLGDETFGKGLGTATAALYDALGRYQRSGPEKTLDRGNRQAEAKLLRYVYRMATRPTPFSYFAQVVRGTFVSGADCPLVETMGSFTEKEGIGTPEQGYPRTARILPARHSRIPRCNPG